jgi:hypothetical protein
MDLSSGASALYLVLLNRISNCSPLWWKLCSMQFFATSWKPSARSLDALLNSAASIRPRSSAGTISPPGSGFTAVPSAVKMSTDRPTVRNFKPFRSATLAIGFLNQPSGWVGIGPYR